MLKKEVKRTPADLKRGLVPKPSNKSGKLVLNKKKVTQLEHKVLLILNLKKLNKLLQVDLKQQLENL